MNGRARWLVLALAAGFWREAAAQPQERFDHPKHAKLFVRCETCHAGILDQGAPTMPAPATCRECHDGTVASRVTWEPRPAPPTNLRFDHRRHAQTAARSADPPTCASCHQSSPTGWMNTSRTIVGQCLSCHRQTGEHVAVPDTACATCHVPFNAATGFTQPRVKAFPVPAGHRAAGFLSAGAAGHGAAARGQGSFVVAASCATCHARDFCAACHVNSLETATIQALAPDPRSLWHGPKLAEPASHQAADFATRHGSTVDSRGQRCATCHTQESCLACHASMPRGAKHLASSGPGRGVGAVIARTKPTSHGPQFGDRHASQATTAPASCAACHARPQCLDCHRPDPAGRGGFHPAGFLTRHPAATYGRETSCSDCHNAQQFCAACHAQSGIANAAPLGQSRYHDGRQFFLLGHGQAARQTLESCVSCHAERDCLTCHASQGGRRFNPHGPGFDPDRLRRKNPETCRACHGTSIPSRGR